jgi:hypothetical protein
MNARAEVKARGPSTSLGMTEGKGDAQILRLVIARSIVFAHSFVIRALSFSSRFSSPLSTRSFNNQRSL